MSNASSAIKLSETSFLKLQVIEELPKLQVLETQLLAQAVSLWETELLPIDVVLENIGNQPISLLELSVEEKYVKYPSAEDELFHEKNPLVRIDHRTLNDALPIPPQSRTKLPMILCGKATSQGAVLRFDYGLMKGDGQRPAFTRRLEIPVNVTCLPKLKVTSMNVVPFETQEGLAAFQASYCAHSPQISESPSDWAVLSFDVANMSNEAAVLFTHDEAQDALLLSTGGTTHRASLLLKRAAAGETDFDADLPLVGDRQYVVSGLAPEQERLRRNLFWAKQSLSSQLKLSWKIPTQGRVGVFPAELLPVQEAHVSAVRTSFLYIATQCDHAELSRLQSTVANVIVRNRHATKTFSVDLKMSVFLPGNEFVSGSNSKLFLSEGPDISSLQLTIPPASSSAPIAVPLLFLSSGTFDFTIEASGQSIEPPPTRHSPNLPIRSRHATRWCITVD